MGDFGRSVVYITRMDLQKSSFHHSIVSEDLNMSLFLRLPRELRDRVYDECFVATRPINLQNLAPLSKTLHPSVCALHQASWLHVGRYTKKG
jgi:hypothetical protein